MTDNILKTLHRKSGDRIPAPARDSAQARDLLISLLDLEKADITRIDANARALGLSFAAYLAEEIKA